jgi:hypothetical protein
MYNYQKIEIDSQLIEEDPDKEGNTVIQGRQKSRLKRLLIELRNPRKLLCDVFLLLVIGMMLGLMVWCVSFYKNMDISKQ